MRQLFFVVVFISLNYWNAFAQWQAQWEWTITLNHSDVEWATALATAPNGDVVMAGYFNNDTLNVGGQPLYNAGQNDILLMRVDSGSNILWAKRFGGSGRERPSTLKIDNNGNLFLGGFFTSDTLFLGNDTLSNVLPGTEQILFLKLDANGNLLWAKTTHGDRNDRITALNLDLSGSIYITGWFKSSQLIFGTDTLLNANTSFKDIFLVKYNAAGGVAWAQQAGGILDDEARAVAVDDNDNTSITGFSDSPTLTFGTDTSLSNSGSADIFLASYDFNGDPFWAWNSGATNFAAGYSMDIDLEGNIYVAGVFSDDTLIINQDTLLNTGFNENVLVVKFKPGGDLVWSQSFGGSSPDEPSRLVTDDSLHVYVVGTFFSDTIYFDTLKVTITGPSDVFIAKLDEEGRARWLTRPGGNDSDRGEAIAIDKAGNCYITGMFRSDFFYAGNDTFANAGLNDIFLSRLTEFYTPPEPIDSDTVAIGMPVLINTFPSQLHAYPNPTSGMLIVDIPNGQSGQLQVVDLLGRMLHQEKVVTGKRSYQIDLQHLPKSAYLIIFRNAAGVTTKKVITRQ